jgi:hypothetical protein
VSAPLTRLIVSLATGAHHRIIADIRAGPSGTHRIAISCWHDTAEGPRQLGQTVEVPAAKASRFTALVDATRKAISDQRP